MFSSDSHWSAEMLHRLYQRVNDPVLNHLARYDAERVLREVEAKRAILELHAPAGPFNYFDHGELRTSESCLACGTTDYPMPWPCKTLLAVLAIFRDHPDYDEEWRSD
jgi:ferredoxin-like protein FixX